MLIACCSPPPPFECYLKCSCAITAQTFGYEELHCTWRCSSDPLPQKGPCSNKNRLPTPPLTSHFNRCLNQRNVFWCPSEEANWVIILLSLPNRSDSVLEAWLNKLHIQSNVLFIVTLPPHPLQPTSLSRRQGKGSRAHFWPSTELRTGNCWTTTIRGLRGNSDVFWMGYYSCNNIKSYL